MKRMLIVLSVLSGAIAAWASDYESETFHVATNGSDVTGIGTEARPFATLTNALIWISLRSSSQRDIIKIHDGTYVSPGAVFLSNAVEIVGNDIDRSKVIFDGEGKNPHLGISHADVFVHGITFTRGAGTAVIAGVSHPNFFACNFEMSAGTVSNCVIKSGKSTYTGNLAMMSGSPKLIDCWLEDGVMADVGSLACRGGGVKMSGSAELIRCVVTNCSAKLGAGVYMESSAKLYDCTVVGNRVQGSSSTDYVGLYVGGSGAVVSNCVVRNNVLASSTTTPARGVYLANGKMINSLVTGHSASIGGGVYMTGGSLINCTVAGNDAMTSGAAVYQSGGSMINVAASTTCSLDAIKSVGGTVSHCCGTGLSNDANGNFGVSPNFRNEANGNYTLKGSSVCVDAGAAQAWSADAKDISGSNARVIDGKKSGTAVVDIGAYEYDPAKAPLDLSFSAVMESGNEFPRTVTYTPSIEGAYGSVTNVIWNFGDGTAETNETLTVVEHDFTTANYYTATLTVYTTAAGKMESIVPDAVKIKPTTVYMSTTGKAKAPYATPEDATASIADALSALQIPSEGRGRVIVADGTYESPSLTPVIDTAIEIVGNDEDPSAVTFDGIGKYGFFQISHTSAFVHGLRLYRGYMAGGNTFPGQAGYSGSPLVIRYGVVSNCLYEACAGTYFGGVSLHGSGLLRDVVISDASSSDTGSASNGGGLRAYGGTAENCTITGCTSKRGNGAGVYGGTLRNCLIYGNDSSQCTQGSGLYISSGLVENCIVISNKTVASGLGGGAYMVGGTIRNSLVAYNTADTGGGIHLESGSPVVQNCTLAKNTGTSTGSGINMKVGTVVNTAVDGKATVSINQLGGSISYSCSLSLAADAEGCSSPAHNISSEPGYREIEAGDFRLNGASPCVDAGSALAWHADATDLSGETERVLFGKSSATVDIGAYEYDPSSVPASVSFSVTDGSGDGVPHTATFTPELEGPCGEVTSFEWDFGDGTKKTDGDFGAVSHTYTVIDYYTVRLIVDTSLRGKLTNTVADAVKISPLTTYVSTNGTSVSPYITLKTAATNIADAISVLGTPPEGGVARVIVADGVHPSPEARLTIGGPVEIVGNDENPSAVVFDGSGKRPFFFVNNDRGFLHGITFANGKLGTGSTPGAPGSGYPYGCFEMSKGVVSNCVFCGNTATYGPVAVYGTGKILDSYFSGNWNGDGNGADWGAGNGGALKIYENAVCSGCTFTNSTARSGGAIAIYGGLVENCRLVGNTANGDYGGAVFQKGGTIRGLLVFGNTSKGTAGGLYQYGTSGKAVNLTIADNTATTTEGAVIEGTLANSIVLGKNAYDPSKPPLVVSGGTVIRCCSPSLTASDCLAVDPSFVRRTNGNYAIRNSSPCVGRGDSSQWGTDAETSVDLCGHRRLVGKRIDLGAYETDGRGLLLLVR